MRFAQQAALVATLCLPAPARAETPAPEVPITDNFSPAEFQGMAITALVDAFLYGFQGPLVRDMDPAIGDPPGFDREISDALYRGPGHGAWLGRVPDRFGAVVFPPLTFALYGAGAFARKNGLHELVALSEAYLVTLAATQIAKVGIGRLRPVHALRGVPPGDDSEAKVSFFSGHTSSSFCLASFLHRDLGDYLVNERGQGVFLGRVLPGLALYGVAATVGLSRIIDQRHYFSDVMVGAAVGSLFGHLFYSLHFDARGQPRRRHGRSLDLTILPGGVGLSGTF